MVNLNLTLVIELLLFLVFLWGASKFIFRPALHTIDRREESVEHEQAAAEKANAQADELEAKYRDAILAARGEAEQAFRQAHTRAVEAHAARMAEARRLVDEQVLATRQQGHELLEVRRDELMAAAPKLAEELLRKLGIGDVSR